MMKIWFKLMLLLFICYKSFINDLFLNNISKLDNKVTLLSNFDEFKIETLNHQVTTKKKIYLYHTHEDEKYLDGKGVRDVSAYLAKELHKLGYEVMVENKSVNQYLQKNNLNYNDAYQASGYFIDEAIQQKGPFDLCIDIHRDSIKRNLSFVEKDNMQYAKCMFVVAGSSKYQKQSYQLAQNLTNQMKSHGFMREVMVRKEAYYNQFKQKNMILLECGSSHNYYAEVLNVLPYLVKSIDAFLKEYNDETFSN